MENGISLNFPYVSIFYKQLNLVFLLNFHHLLVKFLHCTIPFYGIILNNGILQSIMNFCISAAEKFTILRFKGGKIVFH